MSKSRLFNDKIFERSEVEVEPESLREMMHEFAVDAGKYSKTCDFTLPSNFRSSLTMEMKNKKPKKKQLKTNQETTFVKPIKKKERKVKKEEIGKEKEEQNEPKMMPPPEKKIKKVKKSKKLGKNKESENPGPVLTKYEPGALSALFGFEPAQTQDLASNSQSPWNSQQTKLTFKKEESVEKEEESEYSDADELDQEKTAKPTKVEAPESRKAQRENRKKKMMTIEEKERTIFVGNVNKTTDEKTMKKHFAKYGQVESVRIRGVIPAKENLTKKDAKLADKISEHQKTVNFYVKFKDAKSIDEALKENGREEWGHRLRVDRCTGKGDLDSKHSVFLGNLPFDADDDSLVTRMEDIIGPVEAIRIVRDSKTGKSRGFAYVSFKDLASVTLALKMSTIKYKKRDLRMMKIQKKKTLRKIQLEKKTGVHQKKLEQAKKGKNPIIGGGKKRFHKDNSRKSKSIMN